MMSAESGNDFLKFDDDGRIKRTGNKNIYSYISGFFFFFILDVLILIYVGSVKNLFELDF